MLILTRRRGTAVDLIDRNTDRVIATITILEILPNDVVRIGFDAPPSVRIVRDNAVDKTGVLDNGTIEEDHKDPRHLGFPRHRRAPDADGNY